jgi:alkylhydroperoxidase/carboxymuconolactone decarboxylase family protein YurZ
MPKGATTSDMPVLDELLSMTTDSADRTGLEPRTYAMVRIAALAATGAPPVSWVANLGFAADIGLTKEDLQDVLVAIAPVIGTARTFYAIGNALRGVGLVAEIDDSEVNQPKLRSGR